MRRRTVWYGPWKSFLRCWGTGGSRSAGNSQRSTRRHSEPRFRGVKIILRRRNRGRCVIVIEARKRSKRGERTNMGIHVDHGTHGCLPVTGESRKKEAMKLVAKDRGIGETGCVPDVVGRAGIGNFEKKMCHWLLSEMTGGTSSFMKNYRQITKNNKCLNNTVRR